MNEITNHYVRSAVRASQKPHNTPTETITEAFESVGWIGKRRKHHTWLKSLPFFDRGPGVGR